MIRWEQIQHIFTTEAQINLLAGLTAPAAKLNVLTGFTGSTADLNAIIGMGPAFANHLSLDAASAHQILAGTVDGEAIADGTLTAAKLAFAVTTPAQLGALTTTVANLRSDHEVLASEVDVLTGIVIPGQGSDILGAILQTVAHISNPKDAHDASAISYGQVESGYYYLNSPASSGQSLVNVGLAKARFFRAGDIVSLQDNINTEADHTILSVNYNTGVLTLTSNLAFNLNTTQDARITNLSENNAQSGIDRSLKSNTDTFSGRLTIEQSSDNDALVINKTGIGYTASFNDFSGKTADDFSIELGRADGTSAFSIFNDDGMNAMHVLDDGNVIAGNYALSDYSSLKFGQITKEPLTADRTWTMPDKDGTVALISDMPHVFSVADIPAMNALTGMEEGDIALVADNGFGDPQSYIYTGTSWELLGTSGGDKQVFVDYHDPISTVLPSGTSVVLDGIAGVDGDKVLFTNLATGNNQIYLLAGVGTSITWILQADYQNGFSPSLGEVVRIKKGNAFELSEAIFNGTTFKVNDVVRYFSGADYWEQSSLKTASIVSGTSDSIFTVGLAGSENFIIDYSIARGSSKETGQFIITSNGVTVQTARAEAFIGSTGVELTASIVGSDIVFGYTSDVGASGVMKYFVKRWSNAAGGPAGLPSYSASSPSATTAAGNILEIQYNGVGGVLAADSDFKWNDATKQLNIGDLHIDKLRQFILSDNQTIPDNVFSLNAIVNKFIFIDYSIERGTEVRAGRIEICNNGILAEITDTYTDTGGAGIDNTDIAFTAELSGGNILLKYATTSTGDTALLKYAMRKWL